MIIYHYFFLIILFIYTISKIFDWGFFSITNSDKLVFPIYL